jgi:hypothetical protein
MIQDSGFMFRVEGSGFSVRSLKVLLGKYSKIANLNKTQKFVSSALKHIS